MSVKRLVPLNVLALATEPQAVRLGDLYFNTVDKSLYIYDGEDWILAGGGGGNLSAKVLYGGTASPAAEYLTVSFGNASTSGVPTLDMGAAL